MHAKQCQVRFILDFRAPWSVNSFFIFCELFSMQLQFSFLKFFIDYAVTVSIFPNFFNYAATVFFAGIFLHKYSVEGYSFLVYLELAR